MLRCWPKISSRAKPNKKAIERNPMARRGVPRSGAIGNVVFNGYASRIFGERKKQKSAPDKRKTTRAPSAGTPRPRTIEYVKYAFQATSKDRGAIG